AAGRLASDLERGASACRSREGAVDDRAAAQQAALLLGLPVELDIAVGQIEDVIDVVRRQTLDPEQMPVPERRLNRTSVHEPGTIGTPLAPRNSDCSRRRLAVLLRRLTRLIIEWLGTLPREGGGITSGQNESFAMGD